MSVADVHFPERERRNAEAKQDHLQNRDQINWEKIKTEKNTSFTELAQWSYQINANLQVIQLSNLEAPWMEQTSYCCRTSCVALCQAKKTHQDKGDN